jgi:hypothetical protein
VGIEEAGFAPNGQLYREIKDRKFTQPDRRRFCNECSRKGWFDSVEGISKWLEYHQSILEHSRQGLKALTTFPKDQLSAHEQRNFSYPMSTANMHRVFKTVVKCISNKGAGNQVKSDNYVFHDHEDMTLEAIHHTLKNVRKSGRRLGRTEDC